MKQTAKYRLLQNTSVSDICWLWNGSVNANGYGTCGEIGTKVGKLAHRDAYEVFVGEIPDGLEVCHTCDTPACINPMHLFLGTHAENMADASRKGRFGRVAGEANSNSKLTTADVLLIRSSLISSKDLAVMFGITQTRVCQIRKGNGWRHVPMAVHA